MKFTPLKFASFLTLIDMVVFSPLIVGNNFFAIIGAGFNYKFTTSVEPVWKLIHTPMEWLAGELVFPLVMQASYGQQWNMHDAVPVWLSLIYYVLCFSQTFLFAYCFAHLRNYFRNKK